MTKILITSPPDRDDVVAEVYFGNSQFAELMANGSSITCEVYPCADGQPWKVDLNELQLALTQAKQKLTGAGNEPQ